jgi:hypothetical protein
MQMQRTHILKIGTRQRRMMSFYLEGKVPCGEEAVCGLYNRFGQSDGRKFAVFLLGIESRSFDP